MAWSFVTANRPPPPGSEPGPTKTCPVDVPATLTLPVPFASILSASLVPLEIADNWTPPAAAAPVTSIPVTTDAVLALTLRTGSVAPCLPTANAEALVDVPVSVVEYVADVNAPVVGVVAPTVPLMLMLAVPVRFVTVPLDGVPNAPLNVTKAPAEPTATASAVATFVPSPLIPVDTGRPVAFVSVRLAGVPPAPLNKTGAPAEPVLIASAAAIPVPSPDIPVETGRPVALVRTSADGVPFR